MTERPTVLETLPLHPGVPPDSATHRLGVGGLVAHAASLDREQLARYPQSEVTEDFVCKEGWTVPGQNWRGVLVADILDAAGVLDGARWVEFAADEFRFTVSLEEALTALVALELNGAPLPREHGGPARLVLAGADCFTSIKWLDRIELRADRGPNVARAVALRRLGQWRRLTAVAGGVVA